MWTFEEKRRTTRRDIAVRSTHKTATEVRSSHKVVAENVSYIKHNHTARAVPNGTALNCCYYKLLSVFLGIFCILCTHFNLFWLDFCAEEDNADKQSD